MPSRPARLQAHPARMADRAAASRSARSCSSTCSCTPSPQPSYSTLVSGLDPSQTGKMTSTLSRTASATSCRTTAPRSPCSPTRPPQARVALAGADLLGNTQPGFSLFEQTEPRRKQLPAAGHLPARAAGPARRDDRQRPGRLRRAGRARAAQPPEPGLRRNPGRLLGRGAAVGHHARWTPARCAASPSWSPRACPGLQLSKVTITDASGQLLWPQAGGAGGSGSGPACRKPSSATTRAWRRASTRCSRRRSARARRRCWCTPT